MLLGLSSQDFFELFWCFNISIQIGEYGRAGITMLFETCIFGWIILQMADHYCEDFKMAGIKNQVVPLLMVQALGGAGVELVHQCTSQTLETNGWGDVHGGAEDCSSRGLWKKTIGRGCWHPKQKLGAVQKKALLEQSFVLYIKQSGETRLEDGHQEWREKRNTVQCRW